MIYCDKNLYNVAVKRVIGGEFMLNLYILFAVIVVLFLVTYFIASRKNNINQDLLKVLSVVLFLATAATMFLDREIANSYEFDGVFPKGQLLAINIVEWATTALVFVTIIASFINGKYIKKLIARCLSTSIMRVKIFGL